MRSEDSRATTNALAARLGVEAASVTGMLKKLAELKLVDYVPYQGAQLTLGGERIALEVIRHHRLIELYLIEAMGYTWDQVHAEADRLEHAISEEFEDRIARILGDPKTDPHGDPIPSKDGEVARSSRMSLANSPVSQRVRIQRVRDEDPHLLRELASLGLLPQTIVHVSAEQNDPDKILIRYEDGTTHALDRVVAESVYVIDMPPSP